ncbi:unnamed protein product, partial [Acidithrix sp. C25]
VPLAAIEEAIKAIARGEMVVVVDDEDRENEGDLIMASQFVTSEAISFYLEHTSGLICASMIGKRLDELDLPLMVHENTESQRTAFTVTVDAVHGTTTGISSSDRAATIQALVNPLTKPRDLARPGHVLPLRYRQGGVLKRQGHTEAAVDLAILAGLAPSGILCEIVTSDKSAMARFDELESFSTKHGLVMISIADLVRYRRKNEKLVRRVDGASAKIPTKYGDFVGYVFESLLDGESHFALTMGEIDPDVATLVRVHSECLTGDVFGSMRCDCGPQLDSALEMVAKAGSGVIVYLRGHEGRGIGIAHKIRAYSLQDEGFDTVDANLELGLPVDSREYGIGAQILVDLGVGKMRLLTNNPAKYGGLAGFGLDIVDRVALTTSPNPSNIEYLRTKKSRMGHLIEGI